jgi:glutathione S-transferase
LRPTRQEILMKLYQTPQSGNAYKVRLLLEILKVPYEKVNVDFASKEHKQPKFLSVNPRGQVPALEDDGRVFWDSTACLVYVARKHGGEKWLPTDATGMAEVTQWLAVSNNEIHYGLQWARGVMNKIKQGNVEEYQGYGKQGLALLEDHLKKNEWLACGRPTIADIACYPYVSVSPEGGFDLAQYPAVQAWMKRIEGLPGWVKRV